ncbi:putative chromatin remodeling SWIB-Plus-3 family [Helianthus annuus]|nr:putative chromatin remodeling SWIB-Plus-3 family [Helianthus annuus]
MGKGDGKNERTPKVVKQRRNLKSKKLEFVGWGSKSLIEFLQSIGKDTGKELSHHKVTAIVDDYVHNFQLLHPQKKKRVVCDEKLHSLFRKKQIPLIKIHELLHSHFADNRDSSSEDDHSNSSEEYENVSSTRMKRKVSSAEKKAHSQTEKASGTLLSCFAAIVPENVKLLYLKRSLVQELVKQPESFEEKLLGSYIRIKSDPLDFSRKTSHQLHPVTGVKNVGLLEEILLQVPNMIKDIPIRMLSDDDFSKDEIEDLCQRVKDGLLKRPTVVEVEQKAQILHEDITKHWLPRELVRLQNLIDRANEKGWRKELFAYIERKKLLQTPSEQSKLLTEVPKVTADKLEPEYTTPLEQLKDIQKPDNLPPVAHKDVPHPSNNLETDQALPLCSNAEEDEVIILEGFDKCNTEPTKNVGSGERLTSVQRVEDKQMPETKCSRQIIDLSNLIELSDDEEETHEQVDEAKTHRQEDENEVFRLKWFYLDPQGQIQGPVSRFDLNKWNDYGYFSFDFKVWEDGQTPDRAILLTDMLSSNSSK